MDWIHHKNSFCKGIFLLLENISQWIEFIIKNHFKKAFFYFKKIFHNGLWKFSQIFIFQKHYSFFEKHVRTGWIHYKKSFWKGWKYSLQQKLFFYADFSLSQANFRSEMFWPLRNILKLFPSCFDFEIVFFTGSKCSMSFRKFTQQRGCAPLFRFLIDLCRFFSPVIDPIPRAIPSGPRATCKHTTIWGLALVHWRRPFNSSFPLLSNCVFAHTPSSGQKGGRPTPTDRMNGKPQKARHTGKKRAVERRERAETGR